MYETDREHVFLEGKEKIIVPEGQKLIPMTVTDVNQMQDPSPYIRMRRIYKERGEDGIYAKIRGKYRWFAKEGLRRV